MVRVPSVDRTQKPSRESLLPLRSHFGVAFMCECACVAVCVCVWPCVCVKMKSLSRVRLLATPWTTAYQAPLSMGFSRQEYWSGPSRRGLTPRGSLDLSDSFKMFSVYLAFLLIQVPTSSKGLWLLSVENNETSHGGWLVGLPSREQLPIPACMDIPRPQGARVFLSCMRTI